MSVKNTAQFQNVKSSIVDYINRKNLCPGNKIPPIRILAKELDASPITVHRAISALVSAGSLQTKRGSGTFVAEKCDNGIKTVGIIMPAAWHLRSFFISEIVKGIEDVLAEDKCRGVVAYVRDGEWENEEASLIKDIAAMGVRGIVANLFSEPGAPVWNMLGKLGMPVVLINNFSPLRNIDAVATNNFYGGYLAAKHLLSLGRTKGAVATTEKTASAESERIAGFKSAFAENGQNPEDVRVFRTKHLGRLEVEIIDDVFSNRKKMPDAVMAINDIIASGICRNLQARGIEVPSDVSVVGFDDEIGPNGKPQLTTVLQPAFKMGAKAASILLERIHEGRRAADETVQITLEPKLLVRESSVPH